MSNFSKPTNVTQTQRFLGLTNFFRKFIKDYALKSRPLHNLLRKVSFNFNDDHVQALLTLKKELTCYLEFSDCTIL